MSEPSREQLAALRRIRDGQNPYGSIGSNAGGARQRMMLKMRDKYWRYSQGEFPFELTELGRQALERRDARDLKRRRRKTGV